MRLLIQPLKTRDIPAFFQKTTKILRNLWNHRCVFNFHLQNRPNPHFLIRPLGFAVVARNWPTQGFVLEWIRRTHAHVKARWENVIKRYFSSYTPTHPWTLTACRNAFFAANQQKKLKEKCPTFQNKLSSFRVRRASHFRRFPLFLWKKNRENDAIHSNIFNLRNIFDTFSILFRIVWLLAPGFHRWKSRYEFQLHRVFSTVEAFSG